MKVKSVNVNINRTVNLGNYESLRLGAGMEVEVGPKDKVGDVFAELWAEVEAEVTAAVENYAEPLKQQNRPPRLRREWKNDTSV